MDASALEKLKTEIKVREGTAKSRGVVSDIKTDPTGKLAKNNIRLSDASHAPYVDVISMFRKYREVNAKDAQNMYAQDVAAISSLKSAVKNYQENKTDDTKQALERSLQDVYSRGGNVTVGYGHLTSPSEFIDNFDAYINMQEQEADKVFESDFKKHENIAKKFEGYDKAPSEVKGVLIDLTYNLGAKVLEWPKFAGAIKSGNYSEAANHLKSTKYYTQVGRRGERNVQTLQKSGISGATDKERLAQQSLIDREEDLGFTEDRIKAPMSRVSEPGLEEKKERPVAKSPSGPYNDYSNRPFAEAFADARKDGQDFFYYNGKLKHTMTAEELMGDSVAVAPKEEAKKEEGVEKYLDKAPEPLGWYEPAPGDMLGGERFSMIPRYPVPDVMDKETDRPKSKVSDILQKTSDENYDKMSFKKAFRKARDKGEDQFDWRGKPYTTEVKEK